MSADGYELLEELPSVDDFYRLRADSGLTRPPISPDRVAIAIKNSVYAIVVRYKETGEAIGMGRIVGDGEWMMEFVDVCVLPEHQKRGLGNLVVQKLCQWIDTHAPNAYVSLVGDPPGQVLYGRHGFYDCTPSIGMHRLAWAPAAARAEAKQPEQ